MTEDQLEYMTAQTERAVNKALTQARLEDRRRFRRYVRSATVAFGLLFAGVSFSIYAQSHDSEAGRTQIVNSGRAVSVDGCNRDFGTIGGLRSILISSRDFQDSALKRGDISRTQHDRALEFYEHNLRSIPLPDCRKAEEILTDDPNARVTIPVPLHPEPNP